MKNIENFERIVKEFREKILGLDFENEELKDSYWDLRKEIDKILNLTDCLDRNNFVIRQRNLRLKQELIEQVNKLNIPS